MAKALDGVVVVEFCSHMGAAYAAMLLAEQGARVIKVEPPGGDATRGTPHFHALNRSKRSVFFDFAAAAGRAGAAGRMARYGFDYAPLSASNPGLIYMSVNAFGNRGPDHDQPGFDALLQSRSGVMAAQGGHHGHPVYLTCAICDYGAAMLSAYGCVLALNARARTGRGQCCETSLLQAAMAFQAGEFMFYDGRPDMENGSAEYRGVSALSRAYECGDGKWLFIAVATSTAWDGLRKLTRIADPIAFNDALRAPSEGQLAAALAEYFRGCDRADVISALRASGVPTAPVHRFGDLFDEPQVLANDLLIELQHSQWGKVSQTGILAKFTGTPGKVDLAGPSLGEHTAEILENILGFAPDRIADLRARRIVRTP
jgi:crotonobetainyl-CoA:carnitine CoA-transferase CaiB-like acyl-CoA transferase